MFNELKPGMTGKYLIKTRNSQHIWDLDNMLYCRMPGENSNKFSYDNDFVKLTYIIRWPKVGDYSHIFFDDLDYPDTLEQWRISSIIKSIEPINEDDNDIFIY